VGKRSIVAAGSVVTHDVPSFTIVAGNPAKAIKQIDSRDTPGSESTSDTFEQ
jgi:acetyltransferase-like isoleucine patch superfamily enzyme